MRGFDYAPDTLIGVTRESFCNNSPAFIAAIMLEREHTVAFRHTNQRNAFLPLNINGPAVNFGTSVADFHGAPGNFVTASLASGRRIAQKRPARGGPRLMHPQRRQRGPSQYPTVQSASASAKK